MDLDRRSLLKSGVVVGAGLALGNTQCPGPDEVAGESASSAGDTESGRFFGYEPFTQPLFIPSVMTAKPPGTLDPTPGNYPGPRVGWQGGPQPLDYPDRGPHPELVRHGIAKEFDTEDPRHCADWNAFTAGTHVSEYCLVSEQATQKFAPGAPDTRVLSYRDDAKTEAEQPDVRTPGPTFVTRFRGPVVVRNENRLTKQNLSESFNHDIENSVHQHGGHSPAHSDGYPDFYVNAGESRDYYYPNIGPRLANGSCGDEFDGTWIPSTMWYHDHAMDITGFTVGNGLAGFYLVVDDTELDLIATGVLPAPGREVLEALGLEPEVVDAIAPDGAGYDIGLALIDQLFDAQGQLVYDFLDHDGRLGDVFTVNGRVQPFFEVERRQYRFRILNASNARFYELRLSNGRPLIVIGTDSWLLPVALVDTQTGGQVELGMGERHDVIVDFRGLDDGTEVFLENIFIQTEGRGPDGVDPDDPTALLKFVVKGDRDAPDSANVMDGTQIRGFAADFSCETTRGTLSFAADGGQWAPLDAADVVATREFRFERANGAWAVNNRFFNPRRADASPQLGTTERWFLTNHAGGWWHPIHLHLDGFQVQSHKSRPNGLRPQHCFNNDVVNLEGGDEAEVLVRWNTFSGPFVFHCHNVEHEDMRMMGVNDPRPAGEQTPLDAETPVDPVVSGVASSCKDLAEEGRIFFDAEGDVDRLLDRGVGIFDEANEECDFDIDARGNQGRED